MIPHSPQPLCFLKIDVMDRGVPSRRINLPYTWGAGLAWLCGLCLVVLCVAGWSEGDQHAASVLADFLSRFVLAQKDSSQLLVPTEAQRGSFGRFATDYDIILDFARAGPTDETSQPEAVLAQLSTRTLDGIQNIRTLLTKAQEIEHVQRAVVTKALAQAEERHLHLDQPSELRVVFEQVYDQEVVKPAQVFKELDTALADCFNAGFALSDFVRENRKYMLEYEDHSFSMTRAELTPTFKALIQDYLARAGKVNAIIEQSQK